MAGRMRQKRRFRLRGVVIATISAALSRSLCRACSDPFNNLGANALTPASSTRPTAAPLHLEWSRKLGGQASCSLIIGNRLFVTVLGRETTVSSMRLIVRRRDAVGPTDPFSDPDLRWRARDRPNGAQAGGLLAFDPISGVQFWAADRFAEGPLTAEGGLYRW